MFNILGAVNLLASLVTAGKEVYKKFFTPDDGDHTDLTVNSGITFAFSNLLPKIDALRALGKLSNEEQIDAFFDKADANAGAEDGAIRMFKGMPADKEELLTDSLFGANGSARIYAKMKAKVPGYFVE